MLNYKKIGILLFFYLIVIGLYSIFQEDRFVTIDIFYTNIIFFVILAFFYYYELDQIGGLQFQLHKYVRTYEFIKAKFIQFTFSNLLLSFGGFIIHYGLTLMFGNITSQNIFPIMYPIHLFLIFEVVGLFVISNITKFSYHKKALLGTIVVLVMYILAMMASPNTLLPINLFTSYFYGIFDLFTLVNYLGWVFVFIIYNFQRNKVVEI